MFPEVFKIDPSKKTPWVILESGRLFIMGRSIPENPGDFYRPIHEWVSDYAHKNTAKTKVEFGFEYVNTSSTKWIYTILKELSEMKGMTTIANFTWFYEQGDDDMYELGQILKTLVECQFSMIEVKEMNKAQYEKVLAGDYKKG
jgi:hypothetical protein